MKIYFTPQQSDKRLTYEFSNDTIKAIYTYTVQKEVQVFQEIDGEEVLVMIEIENEDGTVSKIPKTTMVTADETIEEIFDFSYVSDGILEDVEMEALPFNPILSARRIEGELWVKLINYYDGNVSQDVLFPEWMDVIPIEELTKPPLTEGGNKYGDIAMEN